MCLETTMAVAPCRLREWAAQQMVPVRRLIGIDMYVSSKRMVRMFILIGSG